MRGQVTADRIMQELARIGFADHTKVVKVEGGAVRISDTDDIPADVRPAIAEIGETCGKYGRSLKVRFHDKLAALKLMGDHVGMWKAPTPPPPGDEVQFEDGPPPTPAPP